MVDRELRERMLHLAVQARTPDDLGSQFVFRAALFEAYVTGAELTQAESDDLNLIAGILQQDAGCIWTDPKGPEKAAFTILATLKSACGHPAHEARAVLERVEAE